MERRGFLKMLGITAVALPTLTSLRFVVPEVPILPAEIWMGGARELVGYDVERDQHIVRCDILAERQGLPVQYGMDWRLRLDGDVDGQVKQAREIFASMTKDMFFLEGIDPRSLKPLPTPQLDRGVLTLEEFLQQRRA